ncbi:MAG: hypothetical protein OXH53_11370 [bacterium]|nr:hypothetical protein [bacterium]
MSAAQKRNHPEDAGHASTRPATSGLRKWLAVISATGAMAAISLAVSLLLPVGLASGQDTVTPVAQKTTSLAPVVEETATETADDHTNGQIHDHPEGTEHHTAEGPAHDADCAANHSTPETDHDSDCNGDDDDHAEDGHDDDHDHGDDDPHTDGHNHIDGDDHGHHSTS